VELAFTSKVYHLLSVTGNCVSFRLLSPPKPQPWTHSTGGFGAKVLAIPLVGLGIDGKAGRALHVLPGLAEIGRFFDAFSICADANHTRAGASEKTVKLRGNGLALNRNREGNGLAGGRLGPSSVHGSPCHVAVAAAGIDEADHFVADKPGDTFVTAKTGTHAPRQWLQVEGTGPAVAERHNAFLVFGGDDGSGSVFAWRKRCGKDVVVGVLARLVRIEDS
jgi:hypothetical protein